MNVGEIKTNVLDVLRETSSPVSITTNELLRYINDGYRKIAFNTHAIVETTTLVATPLDHFLSLPTNSLAPLTFVDVDSDFPIHPVHWTFITKRDKHWPRAFRSRPMVVAPWGASKIMFYPAYNVAGQVTMTHAIMPVTTALAADGDVPDLPPQHHMALVHYAVYRTLLKDVQNGPRLGRAMRHKKYFEQTLEGVNVWGLEKHEGIRKAIYGTSTYQPTGEEI